MRLFALAIALATSIYSVQAQSPGDDGFRQRWFLNVTVGGVFDEIPQCAVCLHYNFLPLQSANEACVLSIPS